ELPRHTVLQAETEIKYEGYIKKQKEQIAQFKKLEGKSLERITGYDTIRGLSREAVDKLNRIRPRTVGQASRISGVSPSDINVILIHLEVERRKRRA
ncbi:tRNA uridine-5-carboxymethylaminomethyl(34) synthesis enzyme MnmG, partial [Candidatus Saccharibacteria bacterium]|nr:tRNA uridine-5-carboxymethylaminomethyl(34) synthesis enzyme MnmG [Candidatus Saccharibacteria bacterium]